MQLGWFLCDWCGRDGLSRRNLVRPGTSGRCAGDRGRTPDQWTSGRAIGAVESSVRRDKNKYGKRRYGNLGSIVLQLSLLIQIGFPAENGFQFRNSNEILCAATVRFARISLSSAITLNS